MKKVFLGFPEDGFEWVIPVDPGEADLFARLPHVDLDAWSPLVVQGLSRLDERSGELRPAEMPWWGDGTLVLRARAREVLEPLLSGDGRFLPLVDVDGQELWLFAVETINDCLDEGASDLVRYPSGRIMDVIRNEFIASKLGARAFRIPQAYWVYFAEDVVAAASEADLSGTRFREVWREQR